VFFLALVGLDEGVRPLVAAFGCPVLHCISFRLRNLEIDYPLIDGRWKGRGVDRPSVYPLLVYVLVYRAFFARIGRFLLCLLQRISDRGVLRHKSDGDDDIPSTRCAASCASASLVHPSFAFVTRDKSKRWGQSSIQEGDSCFCETSNKASKGKQSGGVHGVSHSLLHSSEDISCPGD